MGWMMRPLLVVETTSASDEPRARATLAVAVEDARDAGCQVVRGWVAPLGCEPVVCTGSIRTTDDARRALLAAIAGAGLAVRADGDRRTIDQLVDDLRRLGDVEHVTDFAGRPAPLLRSQRAILALVREGLTIREAAARLGVVHRTADRRLAAARLVLGVHSTANAAAALTEPVAVGTGRPARH
jgi:methylmalonyl-CoA mutase cobalamin-binding subunit